MSAVIVFPLYEIVPWNVPSDSSGVPFAALMLSSGDVRKCLASNLSWLNALIPMAVVSAPESGVISMLP